jgi:hypothetical protein
MVAVPLGILLVNRLHIWFIMIVGLYHSWIYIPGLPRSFSVFHLAMAGIVPVLIAHRCLSRPEFRTSAFLKFAVIGYAAVVLMTMYVRGFGVRMLGGESWGGARYFHLLIGLAFYPVSDSIVLTRKQWRIAIILYFVAGLLPSLAECVYLLSGGSMYKLYYFVKAEGVSALGSLSALHEGREMVRFQTSKYVALLFVLAISLYPFRGKYRVIIIGSAVLAFAFAGLSGHRSTVVYLLLLIPAVMYFSSRRVPVGILGAYAGLLLVALVYLRFAGTTLPMASQRAFSVMPFARISSDARLSAEATTQWRIDLWRQLLRYVPRYWLIGRGFAFDPGVIGSTGGRIGHTVEYAIATHNYHSGPLSLLIDFGVFGFVFASAIIAGGAVHHVRLLSARWNDPGLSRMHRVILASYCVNVFRFYCIHGDAAGSMIAFLLQLAMLNGFYMTDLAVGREEAGAQDEPGLPPLPAAPGLSAVTSEAGMHTDTLESSTRTGW